MVDITPTLPFRRAELFMAVNSHNSDKTGENPQVEVGVTQTTGYPGLPVPETMQMA